jgi:hypothetical protein
VARDFLLQVFHESSSSKPLKIKLGSSQICRKISEIFASKGTPLGSTTPAANFATGTVPQVLFMPVANLPPVSTTPAANKGKNIRLPTL